MPKAQENIPVLPCGTTLMTTSVKFIQAQYRINRENLRRCREQVGQPREVYETSRGTRGHVRVA